MTMIKFTKFVALSALLGMMVFSGNISAVQAETVSANGIEISDAWARARGATAKVAGAFLTVHNTSGQDDRIVSVQSPIAGRVELHTTKMTDGVMKMIHMKDGIEVKAGATVMLKPGAYHVMFMGLKHKLPEGSTFPLTLTFEKAGKIDITVMVKKVGAMGTMKKH